MKIAADHFPHVKVIATGSSTLGAASQFRDTLTGRKADLWLTPMMSADLRDFGKVRLPHRFLLGGLPPFFLAEETFPEKDFQEWLDSYWAKDIQEMFRLEKRYSFQRFFEMLLIQSGGLFQALSFSGPCEVSRTTISNYLAVLESTYAVHVLRPFSSGKAAEIVSQPKVYGFDTGFVAYLKGWSSLRPADYGTCWEHYVLNELHARLQNRSLHYWRDKAGHEIDFVLARRGKPPVAIECKWRFSEFEPRQFEAFLRKYPEADCFLVCSDIDRPLTRTVASRTIKVVNLETLIKLLQAKNPPNH